MSGWDGWKILMVLVAVGLAILLLGALGEAFFQQTEIVEMELVEVRSGVVVDEDALPQSAGWLNYPTGQLCVGDKVRVLKKSGISWGWFPAWYLIGAVEDQ